MAQKSLLTPLLLVCLLQTVAAPEVHRQQVPAQRLFEIKPDKPSAILIQQPLDLDYRSYQLADGSQVIVFFSGRHHRIVFVTFHNGDPFPVVTQHVIDVQDPEPDPNPGPGPDPDPDPEPEPLTGLALEVQQRARGVQLDPTQAKRIATSFDTVASMTAAGGLNSIQAAMNKLSEYNNRQWPRTAATLKTWLESELPRRIRQLEDLPTVFKAIAQGLDRT